MSPPNRSMAVFAAVMAAMLGFSSPAAAECVANRHVQNVEATLRSAAKADTPAERSRLLDAASEEIETLSSASAWGGAAKDFDEYLRVRRNDIERLARDRRARELGSSFATISVTAGVKVGDCVLTEDGRGGGGVLKGYAVEARLGEGDSSSAGPSARDVVYKTRQAAARMVKDLVQETKEKPENLWVLAFLPLAAAVYRFGVFVNRRRAVRYICCIPAEIRVGDKTYEGRIFDFSRLGAKLAFDSGTPGREATQMEIRTKNMVIHTKRVWSARMIMGTEFVTPLGTNEMGQFFELAKAGAGLHRV